MKAALSFISGWVLPVLLLLLSVVASTKPDDAMNNASTWAEFFGLPAPDWLQDKWTDTLLFWGALSGFVLVGFFTLVIRSRQQNIHRPKQILERNNRFITRMVVLFFVTAAFNLGYQLKAYSVIPEQRPGYSLTRGAFTVQYDTAPLLKYKNRFKLMFITRVAFNDRDRMEDTHIEKSIAHTIDGHLITLSIRPGPAFMIVPHITNFYNHNLVLIPYALPPDDITKLSDVIAHNGKIIWDTNQGVPAP
jgi:hypothetical protein